MTSSERPKIFSEYWMSRRRTVLFLSLLQALPLQFGNFLDQSLHLLVIVDRLANPLLPVLGDTDLTHLAVMALDQVQGGVQLAPGTTAVGLSALAGADRQGPAKEPLALSQLSDARSKVAFGRREAGPMQGDALLSEIYTISQIGQPVKGQKRMRICPHNRVESKQ